MNRTITKMLTVMLFATIVGFALPAKASASPSVSITCSPSNTINVNAKTTCEVRVKDSDGVNAVKFNYNISKGNAKITNVKMDSSKWYGSVSDGTVDIAASPMQTSLVTAVTLEIQGVSVGATALVLDGIYFWVGDNYSKVSVGSKLLTIKVQTPTTSETKTISPSTPVTSKVTTTSKKTTTKPTTTKRPNVDYPTTSTTKRPSVEPAVTNPTGVTITPSSIPTTRTDAQGIIYHETTGPDGSYTSPAPVLTTKQTTVPAVTGPGFQTTTTKGNIQPITTHQMTTRPAATPATPSIFDIFRPKRTNTTRMYDVKVIEDLINNGEYHANYRTTERFSNLRLVNVLVDDYKVYFINGVYYATVQYEDEKVTISASSPGNSVLGTGERNLGIGKNLHELKVYDGAGHSAIYQLVIIRPDVNEIYDTALYKMGVVGYDIDFKSDVLEYTLEVQYNVDEVYVWGQAYNEDVIVIGEGIYTLDKTVDDNTIYLLVSYGDIQVTQYAIHILRSYSSIIPWIIVGILGIALVATAIVMQVSKNKLKAELIAEKDAEVVEAKKRAIISKSVDPQLKVNGENTNGVGKKTVLPTHVVATKRVVQVPEQRVLQTTQAPKVASSAKLTPEREQSVMEHKVQPKYVAPKPVMQSSAPAAQTTVTGKTPASSNVKTLKNVPATENGPYGAEDIVITSLNK